MAKWMKIKMLENFFHDREPHRDNFYKKKFNPFSTRKKTET